MIDSDGFVVVYADLLTAGVVSVVTYASIFIQKLNILFNFLCRHFESPLLKRVFLAILQSEICHVSIILQLLLVR